MNIKKQIIKLLTLFLMLSLVACGSTAPATDVAEATEASAPPATEAKVTPEKIIIGNAIALSGPNAPAAALSQVPSYDLWAADVNAAGGIYVKEFDKKIPVEILRYDDTSDIGTAVQL